MTNSAPTIPEQPEADTDQQSDAMKDQLRKDVASWAASRSGVAADPVNSGVPASRQRPAPTARAPHPKTRAAEPVAPVVAEKKPFKMSYDGTTDRDYIAQRIKLGAR